VGEIWHLAPEWTASGERFDGVMNYVLTEAVLRFAAAGHMDAEVVAPVNLTLRPPLDAPGYEAAIGHLLAAYPEQVHRCNLNLLGSHDTARVLSMVGEDAESVIQAALLLFTFPGAPCVFYGDEIGLTGRHDPGSRRGFPWEHPETWNRDLLEAFRGLVGLRRSHPCLRRGAYRHLWAEGSLYAFAREGEGEQLVVGVNPGDAPAGAQLSGWQGRPELCWGRGGEAAPGPARQVGRGVACLLRVEVHWRTASAGPRPRIQGSGAGLGPGSSVVLAIPLG
jgi:cyclomaltodextrinase